MPGLQEIRFMSTMKVKIIWTVALSLSCLKGIVTAVKADVKLPGGVNVWNGSCALLPCLYSPGKPAYSSFIWYHNAWYDESIKEYIGAVVYSSSNASAVDSLFAHRVLYMGKDNAQNCTIMLTNLTKEHQGWYSVRLRGERKWMSNNVTVSVSDIGPTLSIGDIPEMRESQRVTLKCSISFYCPYYDINLFWSGDVNGTSKNASKWDTSSLSTTVSFTFQPSWRDDKKNLTCALHRRDGEENRTIQLNVKHAPKNVQILPNNQSTIQIRKPESITLQCLIESSNPQVSQITWYKGNVMYVNTNSDQINVSAAGKYHCQAKNAVGESSSEQVEVIVLYAPEKTEIRKRLGNLKEGSSVTLTCSANSYPPVSRYVWYKDGEECYNHTSKDYTISNIRAHHSGSYKCLAINDIGEKESNPLQVDVQYAPKNVQIFPNNQSLIKIVKPKSTTLQCSAESSNPKVSQFIWYKDNSSLNDRRNPKIEVTTSGKYSCDAKNAVGTTRSKQVEVVVLYAPENTKIRKPLGNLIEGSSVTLTCSADSYPPVSLYIWYKDGEECYNDTSKDYTIANIREHHSGSYKCLASNDIGEKESNPIKVDVQYPPKSPMLVLEPDNTTFLEGQAVTFTCVVNRSNPAVRSYTWYKNNKVLPTYTSVYIKTLSADDAGMYACKAENGITGASISPNTPIEIYYAPKGVSIQITGLPVKEGDAMQLQCLAKKSNPLPTTYEWYKNGFLQLNSSTEAVTITTTWTHSGLYSCKAKNAIGSMSSQTTIVDVHYGPKNVTLSLDPGSHLSEFMKVKMTCLAKANPQRLTYVWYRNNVFLYRSHYSFVLPSVQMDDAGEYHCVAEHGISNEKSNKVYLHVSYSTTTIGKFASIAISLFILIMIIILVVRFRSRIQKLCSRKPTEDISDSSFFVLKKSHNQALDNGGQQTPSTHSSTEQVNYATVKCPASTRRQTDQSSIAPNDPDITTIYSVVRKPCKAEYENIALEHKADEDSQDDIHYSVITNLNQKPSDSERGRDPEVEYAMLRHT
ncbi:B-cell receptor CD22-like isoform X1 [Hyperolius riggenbachi]|uniref:B-cell receptor CD22-like isoform X1 n=1 Tax=Hyperolius riggenbachi TaxID=752182 RepID=UPI0035A3216B